jgi:hypothetical protein
MSAFVESPTRAADSVVSPELALVDSALAELERARSPLPAPRPRVRPHLTWSADEGTAESSGTFSLRRIAATAAARATALGRRPRLVLLGALGLVVLVFMLPDFRRPASHSDPVAEPQTPSSVDVGKPSRTLTPKSKPAYGAPSVGAGGPRRFAWASVEGADGYHIELFRESKRVFSANSRKPTIWVPASWKFGGQRRTLVPGQYQWYVWPTVSGVRGQSAVVQAKLDVPSR